MSNLLASEHKSVNYIIAYINFLNPMIFSTLLDLIQKV